jgi:hypothetical protein
MIILLLLWKLNSIILYFVTLQNMMSNSIHELTAENEYA